MALSDTRRIAFDCPICHAGMTQAAAWLKTHDEMTCPGCGAVIRLDTTEIAAGKVRVVSAAKSAEDG